MQNITEQSLNNFYEELLREQNELLNKIKNNNDIENEKTNNQSINIITLLLQNILKLRNLRKKRI